MKVFKEDDINRIIIKLTWSEMSDIRNGMAVKHFQDGTITEVWLQKEEEALEDTKSDEIIPYTGPFISTWLQGHIDTTYTNLVKVFGEPAYLFEGTGDKVDAEWDLMTPAGIATIYNYKDGKSYLGEEGTPVQDITDWHIGGTNPEVVGHIEKALEP